MGVSLREVFTPLMSYVVLLARTPSLHQRAFADLRRDVRRLLDEQQALVKRHDIPAADYDAARFAAVAWADELVVRCTHDSNREISQQWKRSPLQVELYDTANAGEEFYTRLDALRPAQTDVREIYHLCLCLGFRGRYYDDTQEYKLVELRRQTGQHLPLAVPDLLEVEKTQERVTPQPYQVQPPPTRSVGGPSTLLWTIGALAVAGACAGVIVYLMWPSGGRPSAAILADLRQRLSALTCWKLEALDFQAGKGLVTVSGRVESDEQRQQIRQALKGVPEVKEVQDAFTVVPRPFCEVLETLAPFESGGTASGASLSVRPQKGCDTTYLRGESLVFTVAAQRPLQHVYVDYYVADRTAVAHLLPNAKHPDAAPKTQTSVTLGEPGSDTQWQVEPPFGMELITVISSPKPLGGQQRSAVEGVPDYLGELRRVLPAPAGPDIAAAHCLIITADR